MFEKYRKTNGFINVLLSGGKYSINNESVVLDENKEVVPVKVRANGESVVWCDLWFGLGWYKVSLLNVITFKGINIPHELWDQIEPFHIDDDFNNLHSSNLGYRFKGGNLECKAFPGYYYLPMATRYCMNKEGVVKNIMTGNAINWVINNSKQRNSKGGYRVLGVTGDVGVKSYSRHRAMCLVFKSYPNNVDKLDVNHIDGIPGNDTLDNLEFVTRARNNHHASLTGLKSQNKAVLSKNVKTGEVIKHISTHECARYFGYYSGETVRYRIAQGNQHVYMGQQFKYEDDPADWAEPSTDQQAIEAREISTGKVTICKGQAEAAKVAGTSFKQISRYIRRTDSPPINGYDFRRLNSTIPWKTYTPEELKPKEEIILNKPRVIISEDVATGEVIKHPSLRSVCDYLNTTSRHRIRVVLDKLGELRYGKYNLRYV